MAAMAVAERRTAWAAPQLGAKEKDRQIVQLEPQLTPDQVRRLSSGSQTVPAADNELRAPMPLPPPRPREQAMSCSSAAMTPVTTYLL